MLKKRINFLKRMRNSETGFIFIVGNMFGSKTREMIHLLNLEENMHRKVQAFKIAWDDRYGESEIITHDNSSFPSISVKNTSDLVNRITEGTQVIGIDEVQFFDDPIKEFILEKQKEYLIIATALQLDFRGNPFPLRSREGLEIDSQFNVGGLMPYGKLITRYPQCTYLEEERICRAEAMYIQRFRHDRSLAPSSDPTVVVGGGQIYEPRCLEHFIFPD